MGFACKPLLFRNGDTLDQILLAEKLTGRLAEGVEGLDRLNKSLTYSTVERSTKGPRYERHQLDT